MLQVEYTMTPPVLLLWLRTSIAAKRSSFWRCAVFFTSAIVLCTFTLGSLLMTPKPEQGASSKILSNLNCRKSLDRVCKSCCRLRVWRCQAGRLWSVSKPYEMGNIIELYGAADSDWKLSLGVYVSRQWWKRLSFERGCDCISISEQWSMRWYCITIRLCIA